MTNKAKTYSLRLPPELGEKLTEAAVTSGVSVSALLALWTEERLTQVAEVPTVNALESERLEALVCRAAWAVIVALSPTLDESASAEVINELIKPVRPDWSGE